MYTFLVYTWYWRVLCHICNILIQKGSELLMLKKNLKRIDCPASAQKNCLGKMTQSHFATKHPSATPTDQSWEPSWNARGLRLGDAFFFFQKQTEAERRENVSKPRELGRVQEGGLKMKVKGRGNGVEIMRMWERFGVGNTVLGMCYCKPGVANSVACRSKVGKEWVGCRACAGLWGDSHDSAPRREKR